MATASPPTWCINTGGNLCPPKLQNLEEMTAPSNASPQETSKKQTNKQNKKKKTRNLTPLLYSGEKKKQKMKLKE